MKVACSGDCVLAVNGIDFYKILFEGFPLRIFFFLDKGQVFGWGNSEYGQLRLATTEMQLHTPRHLPLPPIFGKIVDVAAAGTACLVLNGTNIGENNMKMHKIS